MSVQSLHAFEKTSIQARHTIKRLEAVIDSNFASDEDKTIAYSLLSQFKQIRNSIPKQYQDVDLTKE
jgi:hypothetical protein